MPQAGFPGSSEVLLTGAPTFGVDFPAKAYGAFPWLVLAVLVISYFLLLRGFRSVVLPVNAVFMNLLSVTRMREEWDAVGENEHAVAYGLEHTGRIITAAAIIMIAAFAGFSAGRFVGLQEFGVGLSAAILLDATAVRMLLVPATMKLLGRSNWYLPDGVRRVLRLSPAPERAARSG